jgi:hypothetical protein
MGEVRDNLVREEENSNILLEGSQAPHACPSDKCSVNVKTLGWLEAQA